MHDATQDADWSRPAGGLTQVGVRARLRDRFHPRGSRSASHRVWAFSAFLAGVAAAGYAIVVNGIVPLAASLSIPWPVLALAFLGAELKVIVVHFRRETHSFTLSEIPAVLGLFFVPPGQYMVAVLVGSTAALLLGTRQSAVKVTFNIANHALIAVVQLAVFNALASGSGAPDLRDWLAAFAAMLAACGAEAITIASAISLSGGAPQFQKLPEMLRVGGMIAVANTSLALLTVSQMWSDPASLWLIAVPLATLFLAYRAYISEREKHERLELLYQSSRILQHSPEVDLALVALLDHARNMFRAEIAEVILYPRGEDGEPLRTTSTHDLPAEVMVPADIRADPVQLRLKIENRAFFYTAPPRSEERIRQAMVSPLVGDSGTIGSLLVANRLTEGTSFDDEDLPLLETLANQAAVALENGQLEQSLAELSRLKEQLRFQAYHDPLTGLANRTMFVEQVDFQLSVSRHGRWPVVLFLDLDDFKVVNDTLGHAAGDRLLGTVAERIRACVRAEDLAARLGGDEFAVLLVDDQELGHAMSVADRIIEALQVPFLIAGQDLTIGGSIGIAVAHGTGDRADELLRNADVAMYTAKGEGKGRVAVFDPLMHAALVARHALSAELSHSVAADELAVYYQPIVELGTGRPTGVEALVRWRHPTRGLVSPDDFIPLAEENGLILSLGRWVLTEACRQGAEWVRTANLADGFRISVNLSPHQLMQPGFIEEIEQILAVTGLPSTRLVLELTETAMFRDTTTTITKLEVLRAQGVHIAVDDFGTGYSSLGYLRRFPVDILKIARDFVVESDRGPDEWAFAHAIVALGQTLGLRIVAEGIEQVGQADRLMQLGCEFGQGYHFGRPMTAAAIEALLAEHGVIRTEDDQTIGPVPDGLAIPVSAA